MIMQSSRGGSACLNTLRVSVKVAVRRYAVHLF